MKHLSWISLFILLISVLTNGCKKDVINSDGALTFSVDTVIFDTVFTTVGSATRQFKIYNPSNDEVNISSIMLAGGPQSKYRMNLDGVPGTAFSNISIPGKDSLFVFVDVTLDPNNLSQPAIVTDSIVFNTNGTIQDVDLAAFGWDADFTFPDVFDNPIGPYTFLDCNITWTSDEPRVIYGWAVVPDGCTLTIEAGTRVYSHKNSGIIVDEGGTLIVNGTTQDPVYFASDRLDDFYEDQAGEWNRIWLFKGSVNNEIHGAIIKNGNVGVQADSLGNGSQPILTMTNTIIENMAGAALFCQTADIEAYNCVFGNSGQYSAALTLGGDYQFYHCTFSNQWTLGNRQTPALLINNWFEPPSGVRTFDLTRAYFGNCIVWGNNQTEIGLDENNASLFDFEFDNCLLRINFDDDEPIDISDVNEFHEIVYNIDPVFADPVENDFAIDSIISGAYNAGKPSITNSFPGILGTDVIGNARPFGSGNPDIGAYERQQ
jgi:hypothetical protein